MRRFIDQQRNRIWMKAMTSSAIVCFLVYIVIRSFSFDFPMSWREEMLFFFKIVLTGTLMMVIATTGSAVVYKFFLRRKRSKKAA